VSPDLHEADTSGRCVVSVLVVDDDPHVRAGVGEVLAAAGDLRVVGAAYDGEEAFALATALEPDVVLMDVSMPVVDGIEATRRITRACPRTRVIMLTALHDHERIARARAAGAVDCIYKDQEPEELVAAVRSAVEAG
jgi:DNA-binding NarL/FixJ family response regulator